jgi:hypothetical protein
MNQRFYRARKGTAATGRPRSKLKPTAIHVSGAGGGRKVDEDSMSALGHTSQANDSAGSLFNPAGIPGKVMVNHVSAEPLQVDPLPHYLDADEHV